MRIFTVIGQASPDDSSIDRFLSDYKSFYKKLVYKLNFPPENIQHLTFGSKECVSAEALQKEIESMILEESSGDLCFVYAGHGQENAMALSGQCDIEALTYEDLRLAFALHYGNLIFLNNCCYGGAGVTALADHSGDNLLISPMPASHAGFNFSFFSDLVENWKSGNLYNPEISGNNANSKPVVIGNPELQKLFFPPTIQPAPKDPHVR